MGRAEFSREGELVFGEIDGDDLARAGESRAEDDAQAYAAEADHRDRLTGFDLRGVDDRANPGQHRAAEQRGELERQVWVDLHAGFARHHRVGCKRRDAQQMVDRLGAERKPPLAGKQRSRGVRPRPRLAKRRAPGDAWAATAAARHEDEHDVISGLQVGHPFAQSLDNPRRFVAERHWRRARPRTVDHRQIGMAEARRLDPHLGLRRGRAAQGRVRQCRAAWRPHRAGRPICRSTAALTRMSLVS